MNNLYKKTNCCLSEELTEVLAASEKVRIERIVSTGQSSPEGFWYDQEETEWVAVLEGEAELEYADGKREKMQAGDFLLIPAHCKHRITYTANPTIWLAVFF